MIDPLHAPAGVFDANAMRVLTTAFGDAWKSVQNSGSDYATEARAESARATLTKHMIDAALLGERDPRRLRDSALLHLASTHRT